MPTPTTPEPPGTSRSHGLAIGLMSGILALAPWLLKGERLPLQNLWRQQTLPQDFPWSMLPLSQYAFADILALLAVGGAFAGLTLRFRQQFGEFRRAQLGLGLFQALAVVQAHAVLWPGLRPGPLSVAYEMSMLLACATGVALGQLTLWLTASPKQWRVAMGLILTAVVAGAWAHQWTLLWFPSYDTPPPLLTALSWLPAAMVAVTLAWLGLSTARRRLTWVVGIATFWMLSALLVALGDSVGVNTIRGGVAQILVTFIFGFGRAIDPLTGQATASAAVATVLGILGAAVRIAVTAARRRSTLDAPQTDLR